MDQTRSSAPGHVEPTPEAEPLDPAGSSVVPSSPSFERVGASDATGSEAPQSDPDDRVGAIGRDLGQRLKPVAAAAEDVAAKALDLSAKGLNRLAAMLQERRNSRDSDRS